MLVFKTAQFDYSLFYRANGYIDALNFGVIIALVEEELTRSGQDEAAAAVVSAAVGKQRVSFQKPVAVCLWEPAGKQVICGSLSGLQLIMEPPTAGYGNGQAAARLFFAELHKPHFSEILDAFTVDECVIF